MGAFKEIYEDYLYVGEPCEASVDFEEGVDRFSELLPGFEQALAFERPEAPLRFNPFEEVATPLRPLEFMNCLIR